MMRLSALTFLKNLQVLSLDCLYFLFWSFCSLFHSQGVLLLSRNLLYFIWIIYRNLIFLSLRGCEKLFNLRIRGVGKTNHRRLTVGCASKDRPRPPRNSATLAAFKEKGILHTWMRQRNFWPWDNQIGLFAVCFSADLVPKFSIFSFYLSYWEVQFLITPERGR